MKNQRISIIDLTAVLIIVSVVAAVIAPVYVKAQGDETDAKQKMTVCVSNIRQIGLGIAMYTEDFDEVLPSGVDYNDHGTGWAGQISPYIRSNTIFRCPSDPNPNDVSSYGYNSNLVAATRTMPAPSVGLHLAAFNEVSKTVSLFEVVNNAGTAPGAYDISADRGQRLSDAHITRSVSPYWSGYSPAGRGIGREGDLMGLGATSSPTLAYATGQLRGSVPNSRAYSQGGARHAGFACYAFIDGHVKALPADQVSAGYNNKDAANCGLVAGIVNRAANTGCTDNTIEATFSAY